MAKPKNKKKNLAEHINNKKKSHTKIMNPFEVHINREKMKVLGRKLKNDRGLPGVSRAKAIQKRKGTLLQEYKLQNKSNKFIDKRIGERNSGFSEEDRAMARFAAVRVKAHKKKSIFNLADDEVLTHRGQTLNEIEKFDDPRSDDEEDEISGKLESDFVKDAHFGGGVLTKTGPDGAKSHKDLINQLIAESKKRKAEKQQAKEKTLELTEKLDTEWKDLIPFVNQNSKQNTEAAKLEVDDYDKMIKELRFEARGHPSDRLKTEDEIAKEEKEKLEKLESERLARMKGVFEEKQTSAKHRSADDLDDDFAYDSDPDIMLSYNEKGESSIVQAPAENESNVEEDNPVSEGEEEDESEEVETASEDDLSDLKEESSDSEDDNNTEFLVKDEEISSSSTTDKENSNKRKIIVENFQPKKQKVDESGTEEASQTETQAKIKTDLLKRKEMMDKARSELPYTFSLPDSYPELQNVFKNQSPEHQSVILERMLKCNHPSLGESNKEKLGLLFVYLLQYTEDISQDNDVRNCFKIFSCLIPQLFDLAQLNPESTQQSMIEVIKEKQMDYRKYKRVYPGLDVLLFLKMVSCLFPTSDFRHQVVTPCIVFMDQMLTRCKVRTKRDIAFGFFLVMLILEYTSLSKRYLPATINFLTGILHMAIPKSGIKLIKVLPPFRSTASALVLFKNCSSLNMCLKLEATDLTDEEISEDFKIRTLYTCLKLISEFKENFKGLSSVCEIFKPIMQFLEQIPVCNYPEDVQNEIRSVLTELNTLKTQHKMEYIVMEAKKPKALRLYEPNIQKVYDGKKHRVMSREKAEREKLLHKIKKEHKGALREIRRDRAFLGRVKIKQKIQSDKQRQEKVKRLYAEASIQQSELNTMDRKNKRK